MNQLDQRQLNTHVNVLGWVNIASGIFFLLIGAFVFFLLTTIGAVSGEREALAILSLVGTFVAGLMVVLALPSMVAGYGLLKRKNWARVLAIILGVFNLMNFPIGTLIGIYTFWVLLQNEAREYFLMPKTA